MNIAICDDDALMVGKLENLIFSVFQNDLNQFNCETFLSGESLTRTLTDDSQIFQIYLLDVEMQGMNGFEVAKKIRDTDKQAVIIFITSHGELMQEAFEVTAFHYLVKPFEEEKVKQVLMRAIETLDLKKTILQFVIRKKVHTLYFEQIEYFESMKRKVIIHLTDGQEYEYYGTLKEVVEKVSPQLFAQVHNSYVVNMDYIRTVDGIGMKLHSETEIMITKKFHKSFNTAYRNYVLRRTR